MAWGNKPWQGGTPKKAAAPLNKIKEPTLWYFDTTSQYRSRREASQTIKGFLSMLVFIAVLVGSMFSLIMFFHWVGKTF